MNWEQIKGIIERILMFAAAYAVGKGWLPEAVSADIVAGAVLLIGAIWAWKVNTPKALDDAAKSVK